MFHSQICSCRAGLIMLCWMCTIIGRGTVVTGKLQHGVIKKGDEAVIMGHGTEFKTTVTGMPVNKFIN